MTEKTIPEGHKRDAQGRLVPISLIKPIDLARDELVLEIAATARKLNAAMAQAKAQIFADAAAFVDLSAEQYGVHLGGKKGNVTLNAFDGSIRVQIATAESLSFDERLQAAKALIDECIGEWVKDSRPEIAVLVQDAFRTDRDGKLSAGRILGLRRLDIQDERWQRAMKAIGESVQVTGSKQYVRVYERVGQTDTYQPIALDIAAV
ncbi:MAG: DUF3164 family protein [Comamonas sp.]